MKKIMIPALMLALTGMIHMAHAQFSAGVRSGAALANVQTPDLIDRLMPDIKGMPVWQAGITGEYRLSDRFSILADLIYTEKGFRVRESMDVRVLNINVPIGIRVDTRFRFVDMPAMLKYSFGDGPLRWYMAAGPQVGYALNGRVKSRANLLLDLDILDVPIPLSTVGYNRMDIGAAVATGVEVPAGPGNFFIDARYNHSFSQSFDVPVVRMNIKNYSIGLGLGYKVVL